MRLARLFTVAWLLLLVPIGDTLAAPPEVRDEAGFFGADTVRQANRALEEVRRQYGKELLVETYSEPPADVAARLAREPREEVYAAWAQERAAKAGVNGIYVLVTRTPAHLQVGVGNETRKAAFTTRDRDQLRDLLLNAFRQGRYDEGLLEAVEFTRRTLDLNLGGGRSAAQPRQSSPGPATATQDRREGLGGFSWGAILLWGGIILVGLWVLSRVLQSRAAAARRMGPYGERPVGPEYGPGGGYGPGQPGSGPGYGYGPQAGGGFGRGILGGLLGGMAGGYLYDRMRGRDAAEAGGSAPADASRPDDPGSFESSGGDFGDGPAGGDASGGGDFGGDTSNAA